MDVADLARRSSNWKTFRSISSVTVLLNMQWRQRHRKVHDVFKCDVLHRWACASRLKFDQVAILTCAEDIGNVTRGSHAVVKGECIELIGEHEPWVLSGNDCGTTY